MTEEPIHRILVVEDNPATVSILRQVLAAEGHSVVAAANGVDALASISDHPPDLVLLDLELPLLDGYEVCRRVKLDPTTALIPVVIITGEAGFGTKLRALELGADDFLTKPFQCVEVVARCRSLLRGKRLVDDLDSAESVVFALARAVEAKSAFTQGHSERVTEYALALAKEIGVGASDRELLRKGATLHDIGKISVPDAILDKPGQLTTEEFDIVKQHPVQGVRILEPLRSIRDVMPLVRWHHERLDGQGYPDGLEGPAIPTLVRILSVADIYDALASVRPYRASIPQKIALDLMRANAKGGGLDGEFVEIFCRLLGEFQSLEREFSTERQQCLLA